MLALRQGQSRQAERGVVQPGSTAHLNAEMLRVASGIDMVHVPYKGVADAQKALMAGEVQLYFDGTAVR